VAGAAAMPSAGSGSGGAGSGVHGGGVSGGGTGDSSGPSGEERRTLVAIVSRILAGLIAALPWGERNIVPYPDRENAERTAAERRAAVLRDNQSTVRFSETPPGFQETHFGEHWEQPSLLGEDNAPARYLERARLARQLNDDALLLLGRTTDAVSALIRAVAEAEDKTPEAVWGEIAPSVWLVPLPWWRRRDRALFPWRVRITAAREEELRIWLRSQSDWLGIGVDICHGRGSLPLFQCRTPDGGAGTVGGALGDTTDSVWPATCAHVLGRSCISKVLIGDYKNDYREPDFALLSPHSSCFKWDPSSCSEVQPVSVLEAKSRTGTESDLVRRVTSRKSPEGRIVAISDCVTHDGRRTEVWTMEIRRRRFARLGIPWPLIRNRFSSPGDSGSWVVDISGRKWYGVVIGGDGDRTFAHIAESLIDYATAWADTYGLKGQPRALMNIK
jgi:hypothetical protein